MTNPNTHPDDETIELPELPEPFERADVLPTTKLTATRENCKHEFEQIRKDLRICKHCLLDKTTIDRGAGREPVGETVLCRLEYAFEFMDATVSQACVYAGIGRTTYYRHAKDDDEFRNRMDAAQARTSLHVQNIVLRQIIVKKDAHLGMEWLERRERKRYSKRVEHTGADGDPIQIDHLSEARKRASKYEKPPEEATAPEETIVDDEQRAA